MLERIFCVWLAKMTKKKEIESRLKMLLMNTNHDQKLYQNGHYYFLNNNNKSKTMLLDNCALEWRP